MLVERVREREVVSRIKISDAEIDALIEKRRSAAGASAQLNIAQILVTVPDGAARGGRRRAARARRGGAARASAAARTSPPSRARSRKTATAASGGEIGLRPADRLPDVFVDAVQPLKPGEIAPELLRSGAGFHVLKLLERKDGGAFTIEQTRARHILLRPSAAADAGGGGAPPDRSSSARSSPARKTFEQLARDNSEDGSAAQGGDLGWASPGAFVPEFEEAMNALPVGGISDPVTSRFGVHLIQVRRAAPDHARRQAAARAGAQRAARAEVRGGLHANGCATCAAAPTSSCASRRSSGAAQPAA